MNILESLIHDASKPPTPAHMGEAFFLWTYYMAASESRVLMLIMCNHTNASPLKEWMEHCVADVLEPSLKEVKQKMVDEGLPLPSITPDPPKADPGEIPPGARLGDELIARMCMVKVLGLLDLCYQALRFSFRSDLGASFHKFQQHVVTDGFTLRELMLKRGWLSYPPVPPHSTQSRP